MITTAGQLIIKRYLGGSLGSIAESIAFGLASTAPALTDTRLNFEVERAPITLVSYDFVNNRVVFKAEVPAEIGGKIYEVGLWSTDENTADGGFGSKIISTFDSDTEDWEDGVWSATNARVGDDALLHSPVASGTSESTLPEIFLDLSGYSDADQFLLAYNIGNANTANVRLRLLTDASNYFQFTITSPVAGYHVTPLNKGAATVTGTPNWGSITSIKVLSTATAAGAGSIMFDGLRIEDTDTINPDYALVARQVLGTPYTKVEGKTEEIEFALGVTISG